MNPTDPKLTDRAVDDLPLHRGRAELLEEIVNSPVLDNAPVRIRAPRRPSRYLVPLAAAAAVVAALAAAPLWWGANVPTQPGFAAAPSATATPDPAQEFRMLLDAPGWTVQYASSGAGVRYRNGPASLDISWNPVPGLYAQYVEDREHIVEPAAPGAPVEVLGRSGQMWAYSPRDHTVIREVAAGHWTEIRGQGISRADYLDLLGRLQLVGLDDFESTLPDRFVTTDERDPAITAITDGIAAALGPARGLAPMGRPEPTFHTDVNGRYDLGAYVSGVVACGWLEQYDAGRRAGDPTATTDAAQALATSRHWPILREMDAEGDYPEVLWSYADDAAAGRSVDGYQGGLGCP